MHVGAPRCDYCHSPLASVHCAACFTLNAAEANHCVGCGEKLVDADLTEPGFALGDFSKFEHYEEVEIPL